MQSIPDSTFFVADSKSVWKWWYEWYLCLSAKPADSNSLQSQPIETESPLFIKGAEICAPVHGKADFKLSDIIQEFDITTVNRTYSVSTNRVFAVTLYQRRVPLALPCSLLGLLITSVAGFASFINLTSGIIREIRSKASWRSMQAFFFSYAAWTCHKSEAGIMEADDRQVTTVFTVQPSFYHRLSTNRVSWSVTIVGDRRGEVWLHVRRQW